MSKYTANNHHHKLVPIMSIALAFPIALVGGFLLIVNATAHDEPMPDDSMLALPRVRIAAVDNAYTELEKLIAVQAQIMPNATEPITDDKLEAMLNGESWDEAYTADILEKQAPLIAGFLIAADKPEFQDPLFADPAKIDINTFPNTNVPTRWAAKLTALDAINQAKSGQVDQGLNQAIKIVRLGHIMEIGQGALIDYLIGSSVKQIGLSAIRQIALNSALTPAQVTDAVKNLEPYRDSRAGAIYAMKMENAFRKFYLPQAQHLDTLYGLYNMTPDKNGNNVAKPPVWLTILERSGQTKYFYRPNQTWRFALDQAKAGVALAQEDCVTVDSDPPRQRHFWKYDLHLIFVKNVIGKLLDDMSNVSLGGLSTKRCNEPLAISATEVALAISAYRKDNVTPPTALGQLVPKYLEAVPLDPYNEQPLIYQPDKKLVYSVGPKRKDFGGSPLNKDWSHLENPSFLVSK